MHGRRRRQPRGGGDQPAQPSQVWPEQLPQQHPPFPVQQQFNYNERLYLQNPNLLFFNNLHHNIPNVPFQQIPNFHPRGPPFQWQNPNCQNPRSSLPAPPDTEQAQPKPEFMINVEVLSRCDRAVIKARQDILASGEYVSAWKVTQAALLELKADSWESLGFKMQTVPSLNQLMAVEGKINTFIHCFVGVRKITSLYDLESALCENEGVQKFEELELGPLVRHPLVLHYFSVSPDVKEAFRITSEELVSYLNEFMNSRRRKEVKIDELLDFIAEKKSLAGREKLVVRIQSLGWHISLLQKSAQYEIKRMRKYVRGLKKRFGIMSRHPLLSLQKESLEERFKDISQNLKSLSSVNVNFCGKHTRFLSSGSDDNYDCADDDDSEDGRDTKHEDHQHGDDVKADLNFTSQNFKSSDRVSSCPYPSVSEEMTRLGLKPQVGDSTEDDIGNESIDVKSSRKKRKRKRESSGACGSASLPRKLPKRDKGERNPNAGDTKKISCNKDNSDPPLVSVSTRTFITAWLGICRDSTVDEVVDLMLDLCVAKKKKQLKRLFSEYPFAGLFDVAVQSIKHGMWDSVCDTSQNFGREVALNSSSDKQPDNIRMKVESDQKDPPVSTEEISKDECGVVIEDIIENISSFFCHDGNFVDYTNPTKEIKFSFLRKLYRCETWLIEQLSIKDFECLGYGDFILFLERYLHLLPNGLQKYLIGEAHENPSFEVYMLRLQLDVLLSQVSSTICENEKISKKAVLELLGRQFPSVCFKSVESNSFVDFWDTFRANKGNIICDRVLFSATLLRKSGTGGSCALNQKILLDSAGSQADVDHNAGSLGSVTSKDAIEVLLGAPMLADLDYWAHWELIFAPSLGSLLIWLLNEVNTNELLCLVTKGGKIIRLDHSATVESFVEALLEGSSFRTAVKLLSLVAIYGGEKNVPLSLLKFHAEKAFKASTKISMGKELFCNQEFIAHEAPLPRDDASKEYTFKSSSDKLCRENVNEVTRAWSKFVLDCLGYLPTEFCSFVASVLLAGLQALVKDAPSVILSECKKAEQRIMLHEVGFSLGILEWINDYHMFASSRLNNSVISLKSSCSKGACFNLNGDADVAPSTLKDFHPTVVSVGAPMKPEQNGDHKEVKLINKIAEFSTHPSSDDSVRELCEPNQVSNPAEVIESIRRDEFGLDSSLSLMENKLLLKQHTRLGRALNCLSQELYSQDSHFLLELVQNADDNIYPQNVEPSLTFVLQEGGIVVLNNEIGFSAENIRALCDVGNSTKRGANAGYIGKKGIGFKSVFRVTNAPEIHSNGFHIKFDITEGQIGFVLPTTVPACDIDLYSQLVSTNTDKMGSNVWKTCIVLPFKAKLSEGFTTTNIVSMFSDLHPSLLLFLHRLQCIRLKNMLDNSLIVMRKEVFPGSIIKVSTGKEKMVWLVVAKKLQVNTIRPDAKETEISLAFTLEETGDGGYIPVLNQQPVFAFLPLRTYGLKFIIQGDFVLPSSREEVDGNSPWNQWILSEFPELFVAAQKSFSDLPCFMENPAKAVTAFMSFVPLVGQVHGFFSSLPRMIISKLRMSKCLLLEANHTEWVLPSMVLRNWDEQAHALLPDSLLHEHLGMGFLRKEICLSDPLARALGIEEYGPKILLHVISSLSQTKSGLKNVGLDWLSTWMNECYLMSLNCGDESDLIVNLKKIPFIPLSDGTYSSVERGTIWLHCGANGVENEYDLRSFAKLYAKLQTVNPALLSAGTVVDKSYMGASISDNVSRMLIKVGVQQLSAHEIVKVHILPAIACDLDSQENKDLLTEYLSFLMFHLQSSCPNCCTEKDWIVDFLCNKASIFTNFGYKRLNAEPIHFGKEFGNPIDISCLIDDMDITWHEIDSIYLRHPITKSVPNGMLKWRNFFQELGITDFVKVVQVKKCIGDLSNPILKNVIWDGEMTLMRPIANDWESQELANLLSQVSLRGNRERCKYLLEILDTLWDNYFSDKVFGYCITDSCELGKPFNSSFISTLQNVKWMVSTMDDELHYPKDLFHDCELVRSILGVVAPYAAPKVRSQKLLDILGMKSLVGLDDILSLLEAWRRTKTPLKASISQMSKFYTFIWNEMATSKPKILEKISYGAFIFIPHASGSSVEDIVTGSLLSPKEVCWHDSTGSMDQLHLLDPIHGSDMTHLSSVRMLQNLYPTLHDFFVNECGVEELPSVDGYLEILLQLSKSALPSQVARTVFNVFSKLADQLQCGLLNDETLERLKERFKEKDCVVLPTAQDKWVSLHHSFGLVCWSDDDKLRFEFKNLDGVDLLYFGHLSDEDKQFIHTKLATLMKGLGVPALSSVVSRQAIYYGPTDSSFKASVVNWALPYAQRYIFHVHPDKYLQLKQSGLKKVRCLRIVEVEKLFYKNVIKTCGVASHKRFECSCLLQGNNLHVTRQSDLHSIFLELSRAFFDDVPELHLANFLHMITTMVEAGSTQEQTEFFILNSQKVPKLPDVESLWSLFPQSVMENDELDVTNSVSTIIDVSNSLKKTKRMPGISSNWPPADWKTAPGFGFASAFVSNTQASDSFRIADIVDAEEVTIQKNAKWPPASWEDASGLDLVHANGLLTQECYGIQITETEDAKQSTDPTDGMPSDNMHSNWTFQDAEVTVDQTDHVNDVMASGLNRACDSVEPVTASDGLDLTLPDGLNQISGGVISAQAVLTGRMGEFVAFKYFLGKAGETPVKWVNEACETGLPYDILIGNREPMEYIEVKATKFKSATRDLVFISTREWQFALEKGESFSIAHVIFLDDNTARVTVYKNVVKLCQLGKLRLAVIMPKALQLSSVS